MEAMAVASMTGYARAEGQHGPLAWTWDVKSVNGRGLDLRVRLPSGWEALELPARERIGARLRRGNVTANLNLTRTAAAGLRVNTEMVERVAEILRDWQARYPDFAPPRLDAILGVRGVLEEGDAAEDDERAREAARQALLAGLDAALDALEAMRRQEGGRLHAVLTQRLDEIENLAGRAESSAALRPEALRERLRTQVRALLEAGDLPEERLAQEAALLATKADVREELDRLKAHVAAARELLAAGGAVGRRLDFLCQEFNREANTLCSKSGDVGLTRIGLDLKAVIDQFREQVQNIE